MKKYLIVLLALSMVMAFGFGVLAEEHEDGEIVEWAQTYWEDYEYDENYDNMSEGSVVIWVNEYDPENEDYTFLPFNREGVKFDRNEAPADSKYDGLDEDQELAVTVPVEAFIPCYLELTVTGNEGRTGMKSYGPESSGEAIAGSLEEGTGYGIFFDNEIGGFVDEDWNAVGRGSNFNFGEVEGDVYIGACDIMKVEAYGNEAYRYEVTGEALAKAAGDVNDNDGDLLPLHMRTSLDTGSTWVEDEFLGAPETIEFGDYAAGTELEALHYFRVPTNTGIHHGQYSGVLTFRIVSI